MLYNKSGIVTARSMDGGMLCFKMSAGSRKWDETNILTLTLTAVKSRAEFVKFAFYLIFPNQLLKMVFSYFFWLHIFQ